ncbi:unnamed protein product [Coffea canephora]|uniref:26S proteasome non-ATPase regulatory subunit 1/RPN2 N-terminal domain-containing protein n=1 Tax=Coffea canephora TaxID=49390 RepID=A0A068U9I2_COFCA|nr:unnamed protein product [Coffea canephora]
MKLHQKFGVYTRRNIFPIFFFFLLKIVSQFTRFLWNISLIVTFLHIGLHFVILNTIKQSVEIRNNICHNTTIHTNSIMDAVTTFYLTFCICLNYQNWLTRATNWTKFSATALQVINRGHLQQGKSLIHPCHTVELAIVQRMLDKYQALIQSDNIQVTLYYCNHVYHNLVNSRKYQHIKISEILTSSTLIHMSPDYLSICQFLMFLDRSEDIAAVFEKLLRTKSKNDGLLGFQIAFDLVQNEHQAYLLKMSD